MNKAALLARRLPTDTVELDGVGTVTVRGMSRREVLDMLNDRSDEDAILAACVVDPALTVDEVAQWRDGALAGEVAKVVRKVMELSGLAEGAAKSGVPAAGE